MKIYDFESTKTNFLEITDFDNFFEVFLDKKGYYFYNLNETLYLDVSDNALLTYKLNYPMHWTLISYNLYGTTRLAWLLMKLNNVTCENVFSIIPAGTNIKYISKKYIETIVGEMNGYND